MYNFFPEHVGFGRSSRNTGIYAEVAHAVILNLIHSIDPDLGSQIRLGSEASGSGNSCFVVMRPSRMWIRSSRVCVDEI